MPFTINQVRGFLGLRPGLAGDHTACISRAEFQSGIYDDKIPDEQESHVFSMDLGFPPDTVRRFRQFCGALDEAETDGWGAEASRR